MRAQTSRRSTRSSQPNSGGGTARRLRVLRRRLFVLALVLGGATASGQEPDWVEVVSPNFRIISNASESDANRVAREFEVIRSVFRAALPALVAEPRRPLTILAVRNESGLIALLPQFADGTSVKPVGAFLQGSLEHHIVLRVDASRYQDFRPIYHEYFHVLTGLNTGRLPTWLMEGLAEVYANSAVRGSTAEIGNARLDHLDLLVRRPLVPLATLLSDERDPHDRAADEASVFYAQSWALTHFLLLGDGSGRGGQAFDGYIARIRRGDDAVAAFEAVIGDLGHVQRALADYVLRDAFYAIRMDAPPHVDEAQFDTRPLSSTEALVARARVLGQGGHTHLAQPLLEAALASDSNSPLVHEALGLFEWYRGREAAAERAFAEAVRLGSTSYIPYYLSAVLGDSAVSSVAVRRQEQALRRAIELNPRFAPAYANLATIVYQYPDGNSEALKLARTATDLEPSAPAHWLALAEVWLARNRPDEARIAAERGIDRAQTAEERAIITRFLGSLDGARVHYLRGNALRRGGDPNAAAEAYRTAIGLAPDHAAAHNGLGLALRASGDLEAATAAFRRTVRLDPASAAAFHNLASALHARRDMLEAIAMYRVAIRLDPEHAGTHRSLGDALRELGAREEAIEMYRRAIALDPNDDKAKTNLAAVLILSPR